MKIISGQFVDEKGNIVPVQIGNREQIDLLKKYEQLGEKGIPIKVNIEEKIEYSLRLEWVCPYCHHDNELEDE